MRLLQIVASLAFISSISLGRPASAQSPPSSAFLTSDIYNTWECARPLGDNSGNVSVVASYTYNGYFYWACLAGGNAARWTTYYPQGVGGNFFFRNWVTGSMGKALGRQNSISDIVQMKTYDTGDDTQRWIVHLSCSNGYVFRNFSDTAKCLSNTCTGGYSWNGSSNYCTQLTLQMAYCPATCPVGGPFLFSKPSSYSP